jgi:hypothetical protein
MKILNSFYIWALLLALQNNIIAQSNTTKLEYTYDLAGNRTMRKIIVLQTKTMQPVDTIKKITTDTAGVADNISGNTLTTNDNSSSNEGATGAGQYTDKIGEQQILIYPNPTTGSLKIKITPFNTSLTTEITVYDMLSHLLIKEVCSGELTTFDLSKFTQPEKVFNNFISFCV